ncbi:MAG: transcriptional repressor LexA [Myxococcales bacterium]|nr:transcriptional repressor LexA [Myxococcales bacterium]
MALTRRQHEIFDYIRDFVADRGYSPSLKEVGEHFGLSSVATVHKHIHHLVEKGYLRKSWNHSRSVEPIHRPADQTMEIPLLGIVAAGAPIEAVEVQEKLSVPREMVHRPSETFALEVRGDSMIEEHIQSGDYVIVESTPNARNGQTVVALVRDSEATLKKFFKRGNKITLEPANRTLRPIELHASEVTIRGIVRGLLRKY